MMGLLFHLVYCFVAIVTFSGGNPQSCFSPQYLEVGTRGIIYCSFEQGLYAVAWYTPKSYSEQTPLVRLVDGMKIGEGFSTGEFDIRGDGSLIINNVTLVHETNFTVLVFPSKGDNPSSETIESLVLIKPSITFPVIDVCRGHSLCFAQARHDKELSCYIEDTRPALNLQWVERTSTGDINLSSRSSIFSSDRSLFTSQAVTQDIFTYSTFLSLLVCKMTKEIPTMMVEHESAVLIENSENNLLVMQPVLKFVKKKSHLKLACLNGRSNLIVWKKSIVRSDVFEVISYAALFEKGFRKTNSSNYILEDDGSLVVPEIETYQEGLYGCIYQTDNTGGALSFDVIVYVPVQPEVQGCMQHPFCVLKAEPEGNLTCSVKGIRPKVNLEWKTFSEHDSSLITFFDHHFTTSANGDVFDVTLNSRYKLKEPSTTRIEMECVTTFNNDIMELSVKFSLFFNRVQLTDETPLNSKKHNVWFVLTAVPLCLLVIVLWRLYVIKGRKNRKQKMRNSFQEDEGTPMVSSITTQVDSDSDSKSIFVRELKTKYKYQYDAVQPIPYIRDRLYCVDRVFVEGGFEKLISKDKIEGLGNWEKLVSYYHVTNLSSSSSSTRTIIEGDPGYGKSTLTLQLAYDWCNHNTMSPLADLDILILLRLRQLGGVHSMLRAIKQFILPKDSRITEGDIKNILQQSKSTLFILDGFDEYPDQEIEDLNDIIATIRGEMFQDSFVVLTSRSFFLPESYPPQTHRIRLTGFDSLARDAYIRKAVVGDNTKAAEKIKRSLQKNSVLQGLCQVPLFFVMFAHMTHESERFLKFKSVTSFFKYMITCFHSHMKNKMKDVNVKKIDIHENDQAKLDEVAFLGLSGKNQQIVWMKEHLVQRLGKDFYNQYRSIGILVEEEILDVTDKRGEIQYKTEVRFYHKLFCEWYAAHYLSREVMKHDTLQTLLENMSPFDLQYTYRFACGLNPDAGKKIIEFLRGVKDCEKFSVLCILEQSGNFDQIKETITDMCSNYITIKNTDSLLLQGSVVQLLEIGSSNQVPISFLWLQECFNSVDLSAGSILLKSELSIPALSTLKELVIGDRGRKFTKEEVTGVITYAAMCSDLRSLRFCYSLMPQSIKRAQCPTLQSRKIQVLWLTDDGDYLLSPLSGKWEAYDASSSNNFFEGNILAKKVLLKSLLKRKYKEKTSAVQMIPSDRDNCLPIDKVFVNCKLQRQAINNKIKEQWDPIDSYQSIFTDNTRKCKRYVLEGPPGSGKSTIVLRMAYDWCEGVVESLLTGFDLFLLVQLTPGTIPTSIYTEIKRCVLPRDSPLSDIDIKEALGECTSALVVVDGLKLDAYDRINEKCDVRRIIRGKMLKDTHVITTWLFSPEDCAPGTDRIRLAGFDDEALDEYTRKVVLVNRGIGDGNIKQRLRGNNVLRDFINVPLFATMFAHIKGSKRNHDDCEPKDFETSFIWLMECLRSHMENKLGNNRLGKSFTIEISSLSKVAFECLCDNDSPFLLERHNVCEVLGRERFEVYLQCGLFFEVGLLKRKRNDKSHSDKQERAVTFYNELLCKWFAAHYIADHAQEENLGRIATMLTRLNKTDLQHMYKLVGKLNDSAIENILDFVKCRNDYIQLSKLMVIDNMDDAGLTADIAKKLYPTEFEFESDNEKQIQAALIHLLEVASRAKISISCVSLYNCYSTVDLRGGNHLQLKSNLSIPVLTTLNELVIDTYDEGREITSKEFTGILQYSSKCLALKELWFNWCLLPPSVQAESVSVLRSRNVEVIWDGLVKDYQLNLQSGQWERRTYCGGGLMTDEDYQEEVKGLREWYGK